MNESALLAKQGLISSSPLPCQQIISGTSATNGGLAIAGIVQGDVFYGPQEFLAKLPSAEGAAFDSFLNQHDARCHPNTRVDLLRDITLWANDEQGKFIFWLCGMAGTGKSTISRTVAESLADNGQLGASFFFKRGEGDRGRANRFFTTMASQLVHSVPLMTPAIRKAVDATPNISEWRLKDQFEKLLLHPLMEIKANSTTISIVIIVIDALDECENENDVKVLLNLFAQAQGIQGIRFRIFVTSRPELPIRLGFKRMSEDTHRDVILHEIAKEIIDHDISVFLTDEITKIRDNNILSVDWPGNMTCQTLVQMASPLFIFAATICRFIGDDNWDPQEQLDIILKHSTRSQSSKLDQTYLPVFDRLLAGCDSVGKTNLLEEFRTIVGSIIILQEPLAAESLSKLLDLSRTRIDRRLYRLHSVLDIPTKPDQPIRLLHLSFRDFLLDPEKQGKFDFWVDAYQAHTFLAKQCLELLGRSGILKQNICGLGSPGTLQSEIDRRTIQQCLRAEVQYACRFWVDHLTQSKSGILWDQVYTFFKTKFLFWVEAMSLIGRLPDILTAIDLLQKTVFNSENTEFSKLLSDAKRFILTYRSIIILAPLQIYCSGLIFAPKKSFVHKIYKNEVPRWIIQAPCTQEEWSAVQATLDGHIGGVDAIAFSPDGKRLASASPKEIVLWDVESGMVLATLQGYSVDNHSISPITFSPDGTRLASVEHSNKVKLWDGKSGALLATLEGHSRHVCSVAFSPDGKRLASTSLDSTVRFWDGESGAALATLEAPSSIISGGNYIAFSPDGKRLARSENSNRARLWDCESGAALATFEVCDTPIAFSPDGKRLALVSQNTIKLWDGESGSALVTLGGHNDSVSAIAFSPDGKKLASASYDDCTVRLWDGKSGAALAILRGHSNGVLAIAFSPDGKRLASASWDSTVRLWDSESGTALATFKGHSSWVNSVAFSPDGKWLASGSWDGTITFWDSESGGPLAAFEGHNASGSSVAFSPDSTGSRRRRTKRRKRDTGSGEYPQTLNGHSDCVNSFTFSPDGKRLASASKDGTVRFWDHESGTPLATLDRHSGAIWAIAFSPDSKRLASASQDSTVRLWDGESGAALATLRGHSDGVSTIAFSPDGKRLASASRDSTVRLWDGESGAALATFKGHSGGVSAITFSPDGKLLASGSSDRTIKIWDGESGAALATLKGHTSATMVYKVVPGVGPVDPVSYNGTILSIAFSPDGKRLASASDDYTVRLWDSESGAALATLKNHTDGVNSVAFSPDGKWLASASDDCTVRLWDGESGALLATLQPGKALEQLSFSADGTRLNSDRGIINLGPSSTAVHKMEPETDLFVTDEWIMLGSQRLLWLPVEHRATCVAIKEQKMLLGHQSGRVSYFLFDFSRMVNNLGILYQDDGKLAEAAAIYTRALEGYNETLGHEARVNS